jgi:hypothetical protein
MRTQGSSTYTNLAIDLQDALHIDDYLIVLRIMDRFGSAMGFPYCPAHMEYNVHFTHDPHADYYAEMLANMRHHPALTPRWDRGDKLTLAGPADLHHGRERAMEAAATVMRNRPPRNQPPRVDPMNQHHRAVPHGINPAYVAPPTPPPPMVDPDFDPYEDFVGQPEWGPEPDDNELAAAWSNDY